MNDTSRQSGPAQTAFTLVELLVVVAIMALLAAALLPSYAKARKQAQRVACLSNQRQIATAMFTYAADYGDRLPIASYFDHAHKAFVNWDTITPVTNPKDARPGLIWAHLGHVAVQQCPSYRGPSMTSGDPYTGYNYNTSYIGRGEGEGAFSGMTQQPAAIAEIARPGGTALAGDGGWQAGANKFMRAPLDAGVGESTVHAGAQAYRHLDKTNVVFADGHAESLKARHRKPGALSFNEALLDWPKNGFLSEDDTMYRRR